MHTPAASGAVVELGARMKVIRSTTIALIRQDQISPNCVTLKGYGLVFGF